jgi:hypothetical protein
MVIFFFACNSFVGGCAQISFRLSGLQTFPLFHEQYQEKVKLNGKGIKKTSRKTGRLHAGVLMLS